MKNYLKLVNFELGRFIKIYFVLAGLTILLQVAGTFFMANHYMSQYDEARYIDGLSLEQFIEGYGQMGLTSMIGSSWYFYPVMFGAATLIIYCFIIWYRDWFGKNTFIYRLLMLPTARLNIYLSKASAIFLMVLGLVALQVILLVTGNYIVKWIIPANLRIDQSIMELIYNSYGNLHYGLLIPGSFIEFLIHYGIGFTAVFILFTVILLERSFRLKGIIYGIVYALFATILMNLPSLIDGLNDAIYFYPVELFIIQFILWAIVTVTSIWLSNYLLNKKITV